MFVSFVDREYLLFRMRGYQCGRIDLTLVILYQDDCDSRMVDPE